MKIVELHGVNYGNKGAQLMMLAVAQRLSSRPEPIGVAVSFRAGSFQQRRSDGLMHLMMAQKEEAKGLNHALRTGLKILPRSVRERTGLVSRDDVCAVIDASGFAYSDQWEDRHTRRMATWSEDLQRRGVPLIFMPQAFGPFERPSGRADMTTILDRASLVFARDDVSMAHLESLGGKRSTLKQAPDFTNLVKAPALAANPLPDKSLVLVPNSRMLDKVSPEQRDQFVPSLLKIADGARSAGLAPVILVHDATSDARLGAELAAASSQPLPVLSESDPLRLKAILAQASVVVGSRYHALVGALSSGTPTVALGWSHKYGELMKDYGLPEASLRATEPDKVLELIHRWADDARRSDASASILAHSATQKSLSEKMWADVEALLDA